MIKINLLGDSTIKDHSGTYQVFGYGVAMTLSIGVCILLMTAVIGKIDDLNSRAQDLEVELTAIQKRTAEVRELEAKRKLLREKLAVIATLKRNQTGPVRVMDDLNTALPDKAWIREVKEKDNVLRIVGMALDNQTIAAYMKGLETSDYFERVELIEARQSLWKGSKLKLFTLSTKVNYAGKIKSQANKEAAEKEKEAAKDGKKVGESASLVNKDKVG